MKKLFLILLIPVVGLVACRKMVLRDEVIVDKFPIAHCINGVLDSNEIGTDCGGTDCDTCVQTTLPCSLNDDVLRIHTDFIYETFTMQDWSMNIVGTSYSFIAETNSSDYLQIIFSGRPNVTQIYTAATTSLDIDESHVYIKYHQYSGNDKIGDGDVYVNYYNDVFSVSCCDFSFHTSGSIVPTGPQYFNFTFN